MAKTSGVRLPPEVQPADLSSATATTVEELRKKFSARRPHKPLKTVNEEPSMTRQEFSADANINTIMERFKKTGMLPVNVQQPRYMDLTSTPNLQTAMNTMIEAEKSFMTLPAKVRKEFDNNPVKFVEFATNPENLPKLREWGLAAPEKAPEQPIKVEVTNPSEPLEKTSEKPSK